MISWGIIGCGDVAEVKSGPGFQQATDSRLVAVMRRDGAKAEDYARRHEVPYWFDQSEAVIHHPEVDAVYIATPPRTHLHYALQVCAAGKPAYVEKPMARSAAECDRMVQAFDQAGLPLFVAFYRRALPRFIRTKELIEGGAIGKVTSVSYRYAGPTHRHLDPNHLPWRVRAEEAGGGVFMDLGCHTLDILDYLLGPQTGVSGLAKNVVSPQDVEDTVAMHFRARGDVVGVAIWNFASEVYEDLIEISGTEGRLSLSTFGNEPVRLFSGGKCEEFDLPNPRHIQQPLIQMIVDELHGRGRCPSTGVTAARTALVMDKVLQHYYGSRDDAFWLRPETWPGNRVSGVGYRVSGTTPVHPDHPLP